MNLLVEIRFAAQNQASQTWHFSSQHVDQGANFLFADGSVHLIRHGTPPNFVLGLLAPDGGEVVPDF